MSKNIANYFKQINIFFDCAETVPTENYQFLPKKYEQKVRREYTFNHAPGNICTKFEPGSQALRGNGKENIKFYSQKREDKVCNLEKFL